MCEREHEQQQRERNEREPRVTELTCQLTYANPHARVHQHTDEHMRPRGRKLAHACMHAHVRTHTHLLQPIRTHLRFDILESQLLPAAVAEACQGTPCPWLERLQRVRYPWFKLYEVWYAYPVINSKPSPCPVFVSESNLDQTRGNRDCVAYAVNPCMT